MSKNKIGTKPQRSVIVRAVYDPTIREVIAQGDLPKMKDLLTQAKGILEAQGDLRAGIKRLEKAITQHEQIQ